MINIKYAGSYSCNSKSKYFPQKVYLCCWFFSNMAGRQQVYFICYMLAVFFQKNVSILCTFLYVNKKNIHFFTSFRCACRSDRTFLLAKDRQLYFVLGKWICSDSNWLYMYMSNVSMSRVTWEELNNNISHFPMIQFFLLFCSKKLILLNIKFKRNSPSPPTPHHSHSIISELFQIRVNWYSH